MWRRWPLQSPMMIGTRQRRTDFINYCECGIGVCVEPVVDGTTSAVVTVEPLEDGMGASVEAVDWNVEGITSSTAVDA